MSQIEVQAFLDADSQTFSYLLYDSQSLDGVIIDPVLDFDYAAGRTATTSADKIAACIDEKGIQLHWVLETHAHADHLSAAPYFRQRYQCKIAIGEHIKAVQAHFDKVFNIKPTLVEQFDCLLVDQQVLEVGSMRIEVMHTPGHTPADVTYLVNQQMAFVGDTLFMPDVGTARCDFPGGDAATLFNSIQRVLALPPECALYMCHDYPGKGRTHQPKTTVAAQRASNIHVKQGTTEAEFIQMRQTRDATLAVPKLLLPAIQVNIHAGQLPEPDDNGQRYIRVPLNVF